MKGEGWLVLLGLGWIILRGSGMTGGFAAGGTPNFGGFSSQPNGTGNANGARINGVLIAGPYGGRVGPTGGGAYHW